MRATALLPAVPLLYPLKAPNLSSMATFRVVMRHHVLLGNVGKQKTVMGQGWKAATSPAEPTWWECRRDLNLQALLTYLLM